MTHSDTAINDLSTNDATTISDLEHRYYHYLRQKGYSSVEALQEVLRWYLPYFERFPTVLDIGCGHGEFLQLLRAAGHEAVGIDIDPAMVAACTERGLTAYEADALAWLRTQPARFDAIFSSNVIEHMDAATVQQLIHAAYQALRPGGMLLLGTPNPESAIVQLHEFWRDPTHVRLYHRQLLEFFLADAGFTEIQSDYNAPAQWEGIEMMLDPVHLPTGRTYSWPALQQLAPESPMPQKSDLLPAAPEPTASWRQRLAFRLQHLVFKKLLEPYIDLIYAQLVQQHVATIQLQQAAQQDTYQNMQLLLSSLQTVVQELDEETRTLVETRFSQLGNSQRFLFPSREIFVCGYKAAQPAED
ncbi:MAG: class I SAM-dependent methyltransferase [Caldilineaceae bacterium]